MKKLGLNPEEWLLGQGTIYPDTIESGRTKNAEVIKTHHNRAPIIMEMLKQGKIIEPLDLLYKDEVRELGEKLGLPHELVWRHPFPGPGLAIRILCSNGKANGKELEEISKAADKIAEASGLHAEALPVQSVGVQGDGRTFKHPAVLIGKADWKKLEAVSTAITNEISGINRALWLVKGKKDFKLQSASITKKRVALLQEAISGYDENDSTSLNVKNEGYQSYLNKPIKGMKIGVIKEAFADGVEGEVEKSVYAGIHKLEKEGAKAEEISLELPIKYGISVYYMIATSEASTNLAKYCGMRYGASEKLEGSFNEYFTKVRSSNFGDEAKRRIILGTFARMSGFRDAYYIKAMKVRTLMIQEYKKAFKKYDALASPTVPIISPKFSEIERLTPLQNYMMDVMLVGPNICGLPHLNVPVGYEKNLPVGMLLIADHLQEAKLLQLGSAIEGK